MNYSNEEDKPDKTDQGPQSVKPNETLDCDKCSTANATSCPPHISNSANASSFFYSWQYNQYHHQYHQSLDSQCTIQDPSTSVDQMSSYKLQPHCYNSKTCHKFKYFHVFSHVHDECNFFQVTEFLWHRVTCITLQLLH